MKIRFSPETDETEQSEQVQSDTASGRLKIIQKTCVFLRFAEDDLYFPGKIHPLLGAPSSAVELWHPIQHILFVGFTVSPAS